MLPEGQKLHSLFKNLSKLFIHGIYAKFGLSWTITLLEAAPFIKTFGIKVIATRTCFRPCLVPKYFTIFTIRHINLHTLIRSIKCGLRQNPFHNPYLNFRDESNEPNYVMIRQHRATVTNL
jgi:hypothetical protein